MFSSEIINRNYYGSEGSKDHNSIYILHNSIFISCNSNFEQPCAGFTQFFIVFTKAKQI